MADDRLTYGDVRDLIAGLSSPLLEQLAEGPLPDKMEDGYDCRICMVLGARAAVSPPAAELKRWHEFFEDTVALDRLLKDPFGLFDKEAKEEWVRVAGELSYARNCTIYALAQAELLSRQLLEPDTRDATERRKDEEAEDAERRLDAQKVGDL